MDEWASRLPKRSDFAWSDRVFGQLGQASSPFDELSDELFDELSDELSDELFDELFDELGAAAINLVPTG